MMMIAAAWKWSIPMMMTVVTAVWEITPNWIEVMQLDMKLRHLVHFHCGEMLVTPMMIVWWTTWIVIFG
jgi:hypothetical protein